MYPSNKWVLTDASTQQYGMKLSDKVFKFKEWIEDEDYKLVGYWKEKTIDLNTYSNDRIEDAINSFGYTLYNKSEYLNMDEEYGMDANWIMAECIFELSN